MVVEDRLKGGSDFSPSSQSATCCYRNTLQFNRGFIQTSPGVHYQETYEADRADSFEKTQKTLFSIHLMNAFAKPCVDKLTLTLRNNMQR